MRNPLEALPLAVALVSNSDERGRKLQDALHASGVDVYLYCDPATELLSQIKATPAAAIIVDLDGGSHREREFIDALVRQDALPVLFNDGSGLDTSSAAADRELGEKIKRKLRVLIGGEVPAYEPVTVGAVTQEAAGPEETPDDAASAGKQGGAFTAFPRDRGTLRPAQRVWVLGASLGGPDAVKRFVSRMPGELPAAFILAQHISMECIPLLMDQIRRVTALTVMSARSGHLLQHGQLVVAPVDQHLTFDDEGRMHLSPHSADSEGALPSINTVMAAVAARFSEDAGAIVFSGIGNDGVIGARSILDEGGTLWAQAADTCVMSSMPDHVRNACPVGLNASPEDLAAQLIQHVTAQDSTLYTSIGTGL
ncbi:MAG TPA: chemotaxis protein CheB [Gammaproteobacteria bacterium]|nr:chemotaxis protein CheB [Gammaproteobacteria bacterium]